eukprot:40657-Pyramimonas_sp.AAC.1
MREGPLECFPQEPIVGRRTAACLQTPEGVQTARVICSLLSRDWLAPRAYMLPPLARLARAAG